MTKLIGGSVVKRKKNPAKKFAISIIAPGSEDISAVKISSVESADGSIKWTPTIKEQTSKFIVVELNRIVITPIVKVGDPPDSGSLTITLDDVPEGVSSVISDIPVVFIEDLP